MAAAVFITGINLKRMKRMENVLWSDILAQKSNTPAVVKHLYEGERPRIEAAAAFLQNEKPIVLIGVASAQYLCMPAEVYLAQNGRVASTVCAGEALYTLLPALQHANVVINSRSGETAEVVRLAQALDEAGIPFVAITNEPESTLAKKAAHVVWSKTRKDDLVSINVVTGMMIATLALAAAAVGKLDALRPELEKTATAMEDVLARAAGLREQAGAMFEGIRPVYLLYRGAAKGSAYCGRLVLEEVSRTPSIAMGAAEFRQGPNEVVDEQFGAVVFAGEGKTGELNRSLSRDILSKGGRVLLVGSLNGETSSERLCTFATPELPAYLRPILDVVPVQALAYELARRKGLEPGTVRYITKIILSEEGIPNLS
jgi:glutamine---fructose-6-phosphate transaminase (isomerizing)